VYLRVHYLSDVLGGWGLGAAVFAVCGCAALLVAAVRHNVRVA
jgi:membrane-associated phospholipid phosphatase